MSDQSNQKNKNSAQKSTEQSVKQKQSQNNLVKPKSKSLDSIQQHFNRNVWHVTNTAAKNKIESRKANLEKIGHDLWLNPETDVSNEAHNYLCDILSKLGCAVKRNYKLHTGFKATFKSDFESEQKVPVIGLICQYDSHNSCGHNLSTEATIGAVMGVRAAMLSDTRLKGKLVILGIPASELKGNKGYMKDNGAFDGIDVVMAVHPSNQNVLMPNFYALQRVVVIFSGNRCHIDCVKKFSGGNAMDAAIICYNNCLAQSNRLALNCQMHCAITKSVDNEFMIPSTTEVTIVVRAPNLLTLESLFECITNCVTAAAQVTNCKCAFDFYRNGLITCFIHNQVLSNAFKQEAIKLGLQFKQHDNDYLNTNINSGMAFKSSDLGNVSLDIPVLYPSYSIQTSHPTHTHEFALACDTSDSHAHTLKAATALAYTCIKYFLTPNLQMEIRNQFQKDKNKIDNIIRNQTKDNIKQT